MAINDVTIPINQSNHKPQKRDLRSTSCSEYKLFGSINTTMVKRGGQHQNATSIERSTISTLQKRITNECPSRGYAPPLNQKVSFRSLPISEATLRGLEEGDGKSNQQGSKRGRGANNSNNSHQNSQNGRNNNKKKSNNLSIKKQFWTMTDIQNACIPHALCGRDILGAARTGR